jgi:hypothetical protein
MTTAPATAHPVPRRTDGPALVVVPDPTLSKDSVPRLRLLRYEPDPAGPPPVSAGRRERTASAPATEIPWSDGCREVAALRGRAGQVLRLVLEVLDGRRPLTQLGAHLEPPALRYVRAAHAQRPAVRQPSRMTSLHVSRPCADAVEVAAVYRIGGRARALAARFEGPAPEEPAAWRCVTLRLL